MGNKLDAKNPRAPLPFDASGSDAPLAIPKNCNRNVQCDYFLMFTASVS